MHSLMRMRSSTAHACTHTHTCALLHFWGCPSQVAAWSLPASLHSLGLTQCLQGPDLHRGESVGEGWAGSLTNPQLLTLQARLNASCVSPCHEASHKKKGKSVFERSFKKGCKIEAKDIWVR